jgi:hypothetical protein
VIVLLILSASAIAIPNAAPSSLLYSPILSFKLRSEFSNKWEWLEC